MDYIALFPLLLIPFLVLFAVVFLYDVACQWQIKLHERINEMPEAFRVLQELPFHFVVPKCHLSGHQLCCQPPHSLNLMEGAGRTDGKGIERGWSSFNGLASSTKEMGPGARHNTIDDHVGHHNWQKNILLGPLLAKRLAKKVLHHQQELHEEFCNSVGPTEVAARTVVVVAWKKDKENALNPYKAKEEHKLALVCVLCD